jgi:hypothetical protein
MTKALYWGDNGIHQFWESKDHELLILCNHGESFWTAHRNHGFLFSCSSAEQGAERLGAELCCDRTWAKQSRGKFVLTSNPPIPISLKLF